MRGALAAMLRSIVDATAPNIPHRRLAEETAVFAIELAGTFISDLESGACCVETFVEHALSRDVQPELFLILQGTHCGQRPELMVQSGYAHAGHGGEFLHVQWFGVVQPQPFHCF